MCEFLFVFLCTRNQFVNILICLQKSSDAGCVNFSVCMFVYEEPIANILICVQKSSHTGCVNFSMHVCVLGTNLLIY